jgi:hypothetical protein
MLELDHYVGHDTKALTKVTQVTKTRHLAPIDPSYLGVIHYVLLYQGRSLLILYTLSLSCSTPSSEDWRRYQRTTKAQNAPPHKNYMSTKPKLTS